MEEMKNKKKNKVIKAVALLGLFLLVFGVSYALFSVVLNGTKRNRIKTGNLSLTLTDINGNKEEAGYAINLEEIVPMTDEEGLQTSPYQFVVTNTGTIPASYTLNLVNDGTNTLDDQYIKYNLKEENYLKKEDNTHYRGGLYNTEPKILKNRKLDEITILPGEKIVYTLNLWLDHDADNNAMDKEFNTKIEINGSQAMAYTKGKAGDNVEYTLYNDGTLIVTGAGEMKGMSATESQINIENNGGVIIPIVLEKLNEKYPTLFPNDINGEYSVDDEEKISKISALLSLAAYISVPSELSVPDHYICIPKEYNYNHIEACLNDLYGSSGYNCSEAKSIVNFFDNDLEKVKEVLNYLNEIPKIKNIIVSEGITALSSYAFPYFRGRMATIPSTISKSASFVFQDYQSYAFISPESLTIIPEDFFVASDMKELIIPSTVTRIESSAFGIGEDDFKTIIPNSVEYVGSVNFYKGTIEVDNTEEYVKANCDPIWSYAHNKYLR